ncbi:GYF domain-containing protein [Parvularcula marina]|uniref:GYF domain-containing protein n=1 Tax=Parvularcula marina TaxID=2292771 RepID=UPI0035184560
MALAPSNWCIKVAEKIYGPYSDQQMEAFAQEGRLSPRSSVSPAGAQTWREAHQYEVLARLFDGQPKQARAFGKAGNDDQQGTPEGSPAMMLLVFDTVASTAGRIENQIRALGDAFRLTSNVWCVTTGQSAVGVKNALVPHMSSREFVFVVDTHRGKTTWHNMTPSLHSHLTRAYVKSSAA